jgi:hypothetical protein
MPVFMIERTFADKLAVSPEAANTVKLINDELGVQWLISFLSADKKKTYCLYEAESQEAIRESARRAGIPVDNIIEVGELHNTGAETPIQAQRFG